MCSAHSLLLSLYPSHLVDEPRVEHVAHELEGGVVERGGAAGHARVQPALALAFLLGVRLYGCGGGQGCRRSMNVDCYMCIYIYTEGVGGRGGEERDDRM